MPVSNDAGHLDFFLVIWLIVFKLFLAIWTFEVNELVLSQIKHLLQNELVVHWFVSRILPNAFSLLTNPLIEVVVFLRQRKNLAG